MTKANAMVVGCLICSSFLFPKESDASPFTDHHNQASFTIEKYNNSVFMQVSQSLLGIPQEKQDGWFYLPRVKFRNADHWKNVMLLEFQPREPFKLALGYQNGIDIMANVEILF